MPNKTMALQFVIRERRGVKQLCCVAVFGCEYFYYSKQNVNILEATGCPSSNDCTYCP